jgi:hypothetical protein
VTQEGGNVHAADLNVGNGASGVGTYAISGGTLDAPNMFIGQPGAGSGFFNQSGGDVHSIMLKITSGTYQISGGTLSAIYEIAPSAGGVFSHTGGHVSGAVLRLNGGQANSVLGPSFDVSVIEINAGMLNGNGTYAGTVNQNAGVLAGTFDSGGTYNFNGGSISGTLQNNGVLNLNANMSVPGRLENYTTLNVAANRTISGGSISGMINNFGTLTLAGGTLATDITNEAGAFMAARGRVSATAFINQGRLETTGLLNVKHLFNAAGGVVEVEPVESIRVTQILSNSGIIDLAGGVVAAQGASITLNNSAGGLIRGEGAFQGFQTIQNAGVIRPTGDAPLVVGGSSINNLSSGEFVIDAGRTLDAAGPVNNSGVITLGGPGARLNGGINGGTINNTGGTIRGSGRVASNVHNVGGTIRTEGGGLDFTGQLNNPAGGRIFIQNGHTLLAAQGLTSNAGHVFLGGGTLDVGATELTNLGEVQSSNGAIRGASVTNNGILTFSGGENHVFPPLTTPAVGAKTILTGFGTTTFHDDVNQGVGSELRVSTGSTAIFLANVSGLSQITGGGLKIFEGSASRPGSLDGAGSGGSGGSGGSAGEPLVTAGRSIVAQGANLWTGGIREVGLEIAGRATIDGTVVSRLNELTIAGASNAWTGKLDLTDDALVLDYTGFSPLAAVANQVRSGFNNGEWNGSGISSSAAASQSNRAIGYAEATDLGSPSPFLGDAIDNTTVLLRFTLPGDATLDRLVNVNDFALLAANFNTPSRWSRGDFNYDGNANISDFALLAANFNQSLPADLPRSGSAVPEPASLAAVAMIATSAGRRRRKD